MTAPNVIHIAQRIQDCPACEGRGAVGTPSFNPSQSHVMAIEVRRCERCKGRGKVPTKRLAAELWVSSWGTR